MYPPRNGKLLSRITMPFGIERTIQGRPLLVTSQKSLPQSELTGTRLARGATNLDLLEHYIPCSVLIRRVEASFGVRGT